MSNNDSNEKKYGNQIFRADGRGCIFEIMDSSFNFDKVRINLIRYDTNTKKQTQYVNFYLSMGEFAKLKHDYDVGKIEEKIIDATKKQVSNLVLLKASGGTAAKNGNETEYRQFTLMMGKKQPFLVAIEKGKGKVIQNGLIARDYEKAETSISIPLDATAFAEMLYKVDLHYKNFLLVNALTEKLSPTQVVVDKSSYNGSSYNNSNYQNSPSKERVRYESY